MVSYGFYTWGRRDLNKSSKCHMWSDSLLENRAKDLKFELAGFCEVFVEMYEKKNTSLSLTKFESKLNNEVGVQEKSD